MASWDSRLFLGSGWVRKLCKVMGFPFGKPIIYLLCLGAGSWGSAPNPATFVKVDETFAL